MTYADALVACVGIITAGYCLCYIAERLLK